MSIFHTMKFRLICMGIALAVAGVIVRMVIGLPFARGLLVETVSKQQLSIANYVATDIERSILERQQLLTALAGTLPPALLGKPDELGRWLAERQQISPLFDKGLVVVQPDGNGVLAQFPVMTGRGLLSYAGRDWFQAALHTPGVAIGKPYRGRVSGDPIMMMAIAVRAPDQRVRAVLAGVSTLNAPGFLHGLQNNRLGASGGFLVVSPADKLFVAASDPAMVLTATPAPGINPLHDRAMSGYRGSGVTVNAHGVEELASMATVPSTGWFVVARIPTSEVYRPVQVMRDFLLENTALTTAVLVVALMLVLPRILYPLVETARSMREMADGTRPLEPLAIRRRDEVGDLVSGFNYLVERLNEKEAALRASEIQLTYMAHHDALTGLHNRFVLEDRLQQALAHARRDGTHFALLFCDLDDFKPVNDRCGHDAGDFVLRQIANRLLVGRRQTDTVARLGGDEFVVLLNNIDNARETAVAVAGQLLAAITAPIEVDGHTFRLGVSIGIALHDDANFSISQILSQADIAMYQAKRGGKNSVRVFDAAMVL